MRKDLPRRALLQAFAASPVALAAGGVLAPTLALSRSAAAFPGAARVCALAVLSQKACDRECDAVERYEAVEPRPPKNDRAEIRQAFNAVMDLSPNPVTLADHDRTQTDHRRAAAAAKVVKDRHEAATTHYEAECARLEQETGLTRAAKLSRYIDERLESATLALVAIPSRTLADVIAKAKALDAIQKTSWFHCAVGWRDDLALNIAQDVLAIGGAA